jgi:signal transduction histidine kinase
MLKPRSLALAVFGYSVAAFVVLGIVLQWSFTAVLQARDQSEQLERAAARVDFLATEVERAGPGTAMATKRLADLETGTATRLAYVPWADRAGYPAELATQPRTMTTARRQSPFAQTYWARIDRDGKPAGALRVQFQRAFGPARGRPGFLPIVFLIILALVLVPPLVFWVVRPIRRLEAAAHRLGEGDLETPVALNRRDELGRLADAFDTMRERLRRMLHERERLLTDVSHELRPPLARMAVAQDLLETDIGDNTYVDRLRREMRNLDTLTGELLSLSRQRQSQPPQWSPVSLSATIEQLVRDRDLLARQNQITVVLALTDVTARSDADLLARALGNLLDNALKYSHAGSQVMVRCQAEGDQAVVTIADDGPGIPATALPHIFEPFYRPDVARTPKTGGAGLGLAIVRAIVDRLQGAIDLDSQEGVGTTVTLRLPLT